MLCKSMSEVTWAVSLVVGIALSACSSGGDNPGVDIRGLTPDDAADELASAMCAHLAECGMAIQVCREACSTDGQCTTVCEDEVHEVDYAECYANVFPEIRERLECAELTPEQQAVVSDCFNRKYVQADCSEQPEDDLESCEQMDEFFAGCSDPEPVARPGT